LYEASTPGATSLLQLTVTEYNFNLFAKTISKIIDNHAPLQTVSDIKHRPWITKELLVDIKHKQKLYRTHYLNDNSSEKSFYKQFVNKLTHAKKMLPNVHTTIE